MNKDNKTSYYPFSSYQVKTDGANWNTRKYYSFGSTTIAMRENAITPTWLLSDQVNSTAHQRHHRLMQ